MKIGLLTFHHSLNIGSVLQAYCGYRILVDSFPGASVEIIDLIRPDLRISSKLLFSDQMPFMRLDRWKRYRDNMRFLYSNVRATKPFSVNDLRDEISFINSQKFDLIFTGSDTVWMHSEKINRGKIPNIYFLPKGIDARRASLSASVDPLKSNAGYVEKHDQLRALFNSYELITVRDETTRMVLKSLGVDREIHKTADPTLIYPFEEEFGLMPKTTTMTPKKIRKVGVHLGKASGRIVRLLREAGYDARVFPKYTRFWRSAFKEDILEIKEFDAVITSRFHLSILTLKMSAALVIFVELGDAGRTGMSKGEDLFCAIGQKENFMKLLQGEESRFLTRLLERLALWGPEPAANRKAAISSFIADSRLKMSCLLQAL